jgi:hypothetical protein
MLCERVERDAQGIQAVVGMIMDRDEIVVAALPTVFRAQLAFRFSAPPGSVIGVATQVRGYIKDTVSYYSGGNEVQSPDSGEGEAAIPMPITVYSVGPSHLTLFFDGTKVWEHTVFFGLAG